MLQITQEFGNTDKDRHILLKWQGEQTKMPLLERRIIRKKNNVCGGILGNVNFGRLNENLNG